GIQVTGGTPTVSGNTITSGGVGIEYAGSGAGTASNNLIVFSGTQGGRIGISVSDSAAPIVNGNTIFDDPPRSDTGISVQPGSGNALTQIINNIICATGGDTFISVPIGFTGTLAGNVNQCPTPPPTLTPTFTP